MLSGELTTLATLLRDIINLYVATWYNLSSSGSSICEPITSQLLMFSCFANAYKVQCNHE